MSMIKVLLYFIAFLLMSIVFVIGYMCLAMIFLVDPTDPFHTLFPRDLPKWLPVDLAIKSAAILGVMLVVWLIYIWPSSNTVFLRATCNHVSSRL